MENIKEIAPEYLEKLGDRAAKSRVYQSHQLIGLQLADILEDQKHKALYMRLAKQHKTQDLLEVAKKIAESDKIQNKGAYFMKVFFNKN
jgi:hypothetical protein